VNDDEAAQHQFEHKAAALHNLGWEVGAGATVWARAVQDGLDLHESARARHVTNTADLEAWERMHGAAMMVVVAIAQVLAFEQRVSELTGDADLAHARKQFDAAAPDAKLLRDVVTHLDEYAVGKGRRQTGKLGPRFDPKYASPFIYWGNGGGTYVNLGSEAMNLRTAASAAVKLADVVEQVRAKHLQLVEQAANEALRRRYGLPPDA
jgi:hypothetical protein